jgi:hypothetical protein
MTKEDSGVTGGASGAVETALERIAQALQGIRFGAIEIVIHEGRIVQIERKEKLRFDTPRGV